MLYKPTSKLTNKLLVLKKLSSIFPTAQEATSRSKPIHTFFFLLALLVAGCSKNQDSQENFDAVLGIQSAMQALEFEYKPGFIGTKFVDTGKSANTNKSSTIVNAPGKPVERASKLTVDKIEFIQNYILQKDDPSFILVEHRDLLIRIHAYADISNILAPDMRITIQGPGDIKYVERLPATGGLPGLPENSNQAVDYTHTPFTQAYLFKIPAEHVVSGQYKITLEPLPKPDSGLTGKKQEESFTVSPESQPLTLRVYEGVINEHHAKLPTTDQIISVLHKFWPVGTLKVEMAPRPLNVESPLDTKELPELANKANKADPSEYLNSQFAKLLHETVDTFNSTRTLTQSDAIQILFLPIPAGSAEHMQSIVVSDTDWELQLARQFGHALGLGISDECSTSVQEKKDEATRTQTVADVLRGTTIEDKGDNTIEFMEEYRKKRRYWTLDWKDKNRIHLNPPSTTDLMSTCPNALFPHPYYYRKVLKNLTDPVPGEPMLNYPSETIQKSYIKNGLALGPALRVAIDFQVLRRALIKHEYSDIPIPTWSHEGELKRMINTTIKSPHAVVLEGGPDGTTTRIIELFLSDDKKDLVGVTSLLDLPKPIKGYGLYINKVRIASGKVLPFINAHGIPQAKTAQKNGFIVFGWDARETYTGHPALLIYTPFGEKAELVSMGLKQGKTAVELKNFDTQGTFSLLLPYISVVGGVGQDNLDVFPVTLKH